MPLYSLQNRGGGVVYQLKCNVETREVIGRGVDPLDAAAEVNLVRMCRGLHQAIQSLNVMITLPVN